MKTLAIPFIKRDYCLDLFMEQIKKQTYPKDKLYLLFVDNSKDILYGTRLRHIFSEIKDDYADSKFITLNFDSFDHSDYSPTIDCRLAKHRAVVAVMKEIYKESKGDLFIVEDDTLIPLNALEKLNAVCIVCKDAVAACGYSFYWHKGWKGRPNVWEFKMEGIKGGEEGVKELEWKMVPTSGIREGVESIGASGTGCILLKREFLDSGYEPKEIVDTLGFKGQDIHVGYWINVKMRKRLYVDWSIRCPHIHKDTDGKIDVIGANVVIEDGKLVPTW